MKRRDFIIGGCAAATWPLRATRAQQATMKRVGVLINGAEADPGMQLRITVFRNALEQLGWSEGRNAHIDYRYSAAVVDRLPELARELVALNPDVIFANTTPATRQLKHETQTVPIVFVNVSDPVGSGLIASLARPGGNVTGFLLYEDGITGKWLGMLKEIAPRVTRAALVANATAAAPFDYFWRSAQAIAPSLGIELIQSRTHDPVEMELSIRSFAREPNSGLVFLPDVTSFLTRDLVVRLARDYGLPAVYAFRPFVIAGGLMSYGTNVEEQNRQAASYVDRILRGAKPGDLPVQAPTKYETVLNLKTAKALGLEVPPSLLVRADEVIE